MELTRRNFLRFGAAGATVAGLSALAGCSPSSDAPAEDAAATTVADDGSDWLGEAPALTVDDCAQTIETEVLVVGSALAGSMAAYGALKNGAKVTVIERNASPHIGGMTISVFNSKMQEDAGLPMYDEVEVANKMYKNCQYRGDMTLYSAWINRSGEIFDQMKEDFIDPYEQYCVPASLEGIFPDPSQEVSEYISTGIAFDKTDILTEFTHKFHQFLEDEGVETHYDTCAEVLVKDESGRVTGVIATNKDGEKVYYAASKGVVMCTGSFGSNEKMMKHFYPSHYAKWALENNSYWAYMGDDDPVSVMECDDGLGHRMLCWAGAEMEEICGWASWQSTGWRSFPYLMVNTKGKRFMNECTSLLTSSHIIADQPGHGNYIWQIIPTNDFEMPSSFGYTKEAAEEMFKMSEAEHYEADTLEELAEMIGVPAENLVATVERYNEMCKEGHDLDYHKALRYLDAIDDPPYQAWKMQYFFYCTLAGVRCNDKLQVLDAEHEPIPGLYAGGNTVGYRFGSGYESLLHGGSNGLAATHGYIAGESAALGI